MTAPATLPRQPEARLADGRHWERLGRIGPESLCQTRIQLHWAAAIVASVGHTFYERGRRSPPDREALRWDPDVRGLVGRIVPGAPGCRPALRFEDATLLMVDEHAVIRDTLPLHGHSLGQALDWLSASLAAGAGRDTMRPVALPPHPLPAHAVGSGQAFYMHNPEAYLELARWYADAAHLLERVAERDASDPPRCWPHHFDLAIPLGAGPGDLRVGMSPGDPLISEPYWFVSPVVQTARSRSLPSLQGRGRWRDDDVFGAILPGSRLIGGPDREQEEQVAAFLGSAIRGCMETIGR